jgi:hypothetical protein
MFCRRGIRFRSEALIDPIVKEEGEVKKYEAVNAGEWRTWNTRKNYNLTAPV